MSAFRKLYPGDCLAAPSPQRTLPTRSLLWGTSNGGWRKASPGMALWSLRTLQRQADWCSGMRMEGSQVL